MSTKAAKHFKAINRRISFLSNRIDAARDNGSPLPSYDIAEREALIWAVDKIKEMAQRMLAGNLAPDLNNSVESLTERVNELEKANAALERSRQTYRKRLQQKRKTILLSTGQVDQ